MELRHHRQRVPALVAEAIGWGVVGGVVAGLVTAAVVTVARRRSWIEDHWLEVVPVLAAAVAYGIADALGGSGFIAAFVGGILYGRFVSRGGDPAGFSEELAGLLSGATFIVFGAAVLGTAWSDISTAEVVYAVVSLTAVRMVPVAIAMAGSHARAPTVLFLGWFGPRGLASIVFGVVVVEAAGLPHTAVLVTTITVTVALSSSHTGSARRRSPPATRRGTPRPARRWRARRHASSAGAGRPDAARLDPSPSPQSWQSVPRWTSTDRGTVNHAGSAWCRMERPPATRERPRPRG
jgi:NhaP-type Na+/H+ or K+/H+ antiporter